MENNQNPTQDPNLETQHVWGTWEELLLACAVNRHGSKDWDTVAMEVQSRTTLPNLLATARHCEQKFHDLNLRFADKCYDHSPPPWQNGATVATTGDGTDHVPWLDELRKQRVDELRRQVQNHDVSIQSLQLKVKRLEEEREKENGGKEDDKPDLELKRPENDKTGGEKDEPEEPVSSEPGTRRLDESTTNTDKVLPTPGEESDRENQSVNESNSTGSRFDGGKDGKDVKLEKEPGPVRNGLKEPDETGRKGKPVGEESNNGSCDTAAKVLTCESVPPSEERKVEEGDGDSSELRDSVAHSRGTTRESSEVQSSASLTRKRNKRARRKEVSGGEGSGEGRAVARSEQLVGVLEMIRKHEHSSLFERRLDSQESDEYKNIIKQHVDLETIQLKLQKGHYSSRTSEFFCDLYLLFNNAIVFFPKDSRESRAAEQLRCLVSAESKNQGQAQSDPITQKTDSQSPNPPQAKVDSLLSKQKASAPIVVCRKRSSMLGKPSSATFGQKGDQPIINDKKEKPTSDTKPPLKPSASETDEEEEEEPPKAREKPVTGARSLRRSNKNLNSNSSNKKLPSNSFSKVGSSANKPAEAPKPEKSKEEKNKAEGGTEKKRTVAAAKFLKRMKGNTPVEVQRSGGGSSSSSKGGGGGKEQKKIVNSGKGDKGKERTSKHNNGGGSGSGDKRNKNVESSSQSKRSVGRPPKKAAETNAGSAKRGRDSSASAGKDKRPKKRSKK
ncbi:hypothetical protein RIF29_38314 [Crotalaria pallida]|uniref:Bromo domain-containing protein n=1 Tax=Crotalaria pallida TaxID=3830 RepID=A0AAN9DZP9_CROPI